MSNEINLNPANEPRFPISPTVLDTEGHGRPRLIEDAGEDDAIRTRRVEEAGDDAEGHLRPRLIEDAGEDAGDDTEGHRRIPHY